MKTLEAISCLCVDHTSPFTTLSSSELIISLVFPYLPRETIRALMSPYRSRNPTMSQKRRWVSARVFCSWHRLR